MLTFGYGASSGTGAEEGFLEVSLDYARDRFAASSTGKTLPVEVMVYVEAAVMASRSPDFYAEVRVRDPLWASPFLRGSTEGSKPTVGLVDSW